MFLLVKYMNFFFALLNFGATILSSRYSIEIFTDKLCVLRLVVILTCNWNPANDC